MIYQHEKHTVAAGAAGREYGRKRPAAFPKLAPELWKAQDIYLSRRGLDPLIARYNGWYPSRSAKDSAARIVIPASPSELRFWQARAMDPKEQKRYQSPHVSRENAVIVVWSLRALGDLWELNAYTPVVCEGPMDALAAAAVGYLGVALMGNKPPAVCFDYIAAQWPGAEALAVCDSDSRAEGAQWVAELTARDLSARLVLLPAKDLAALAPEARAEALR